MSNNPLMQKTMPAKKQVLDFENLRLNSKYGSILKTNTHTNLIS